MNFWLQRVFCEVRCFICALFRHKGYFTKIPGCYAGYCPRCIVDLQEVKMKTILLAMLLSGCGGYAFAPSREMLEWNDGEGEALVVTATEWWRSVASVRLGAGTPLQGRRWGTRAPYTAAGDAEYVDYDLDWWDRWAREREDYRAVISNTIAHEMGHAMGLEHVEDPEAVMWHSVHPGSGLKAADVAEWERTR